MSVRTYRRKWSVDKSIFVDINFVPKTYSQTFLCDIFDRIHSTFLTHVLLKYIYFLKRFCIWVYVYMYYKNNKKKVFFVSCDV